MFQEAGKAGCGRMIVISKMDADNIDFPGAARSRSNRCSARLHSAQRADRRGHDFKGVASTLKLAGNAAGAVIDPAEINQPLIESIIEVDDEVTSRYFEGTLPTDEEISRLIVEAIAHGSLIPIVCVAGQDRRRRDGVARRAGALQPAAGQDRAATPRTKRATT